MLEIKAEEKHMTYFKWNIFYILKYLKLKIVAKIYFRTGGQLQSL